MNQPTDDATASDPLLYQDVNELSSPCQAALPVATSGHLSRREIIAGSAVVAASIAVGSLAAREAAAAEPTTAPSSQEPPPGSVSIQLSINGKPVDLKVEPRVTLLEALREHAQLTGTKIGCDHGQCGACTVLVDGHRVLSCLTLAVMQQGKQIITIEGLADGEKLHPMQAAFIEHDAFQCGYCTPGQICSAVGLVNEGQAKSDDDIRSGMSGNICRCGAYPNIVDAVRQVIGSKA